MKDPSEELAAVEMYEVRDRGWMPVWLPWAVIGVYGVCAVTVWVEHAWRLDWDSAIYLLTGRSIAAGEGYRYLGEAFFLRPPGLPWLLSFFAGSAGSDPDFLLLNRLFMLSATAAVAAIYATFRREHGRGWALVIALLTGTSPIFVDQLNFILTDLPFLALLLPALSLLEHAAHGGRRAASYATAGALLLVLSIHLRTVAIIALPAVALVYLLRRRGRQRLASLLPIALVCVLTAPWFTCAQAAARETEPPVEQLYLFDYTTALLHRDPGDPDSPFLTSAEWTLRIGQNAVDVAGELAGSVLGSEHPAAMALLIALVATGLIAAIRRGARLLDWFALAYTVLLLSYFTSSARLQLPLLPIVYAHLAATIASLSRHASQRGGAAIGFTRGITALAVAAAALSNAIVFADRLDVRSRSAVTTSRWEDMTTASAWIRKNTPEDAVVLAATAPIVSLLSHRIVYTGRYTRRPDVIGRYQIDYAIAFQWTPIAARRSMAKRSADEWKLASATPEKWTRIYRVDH